MGEKPAHGIAKKFSGSWAALTPLHGTHRSGTVSERMEVTKLLADWNRGDRSALEKIVPLVYDELHHIASCVLAHGAPPTLQSTALVNEAYIRLASKASVSWQDRTH